MKSIYLKTSRILAALSLSLFLNLQIAHCQGGIWTWMHGSEFLSDSTHNYGEKGVSSPLNNPPGKYQAAHWQDKDGFFWMFGGYSVNQGLRNDLWIYNPLVNEWTWMHGDDTPDGIASYGVKGIPSPTNVPPAAGFGALNWYDGKNTLYLYSGQTNGNSNATNLWKYDIESNEWTWIHGNGIINLEINYGEKGVASPTNAPGVRWECESTWFQNDTLWFFGGLGLDDQNAPLAYSDLWIYDLSSNLWTWISGPQGFSELGEPGEIGVHSPSNYPSGRSSHSRWEKDDHFYIYSGSKNFSGMMGRTDLWEYSAKENSWAWIDGSQNMTSPIWDDHCELDTVFNPGDKLEHQTAHTHYNNTDYFWVYGGLSQQSFFFKNDLWVYEPCSSTWTLVWGDPLEFTTPNYGEKGVPDLDNVPYARGGACMWTDTAGVIWVYGGYLWGPGDTGSDLWRFEPDYSCFETSCCELSVDIRLGHISADSLENGTISINVLDGDGDYEYSIDGGNLWTDINFFQDLPPGDYDVQVRDGSGCLYEGVVTILDFNTSTSEIENELSIEIFPNPVSDILYYAIGSLDVEFVHVYAMNGKEIDCPKSARRIDLKNIAPGNYILSIGAGGNQGTAIFQKL